MNDNTLPRRRAPHGAPVELADDLEGEDSANHPASGADTSEELLADLVERVRGTARQICRQLPEAVRADAESAAMVGLMEALQRFGRADSDHFSNYLKVRVRGAIRDEARRFDPLSRGARELVNGVQRAMDEYIRAHGRSPDTAEIAKRLGIDEDTCWQALELSEVSALPIDDDSVGHVVCTAEDLFVETYAATALRWALSRLDKRTRLVLRLWYKRGLPVAAIGKRLGVSISRVHQIRVEGEHRLRDLLASSPPIQRIRPSDIAPDWDEQTAEREANRD